MVTVIGIIAGLIFAWIAIRIGLYVIWSVMFNLVVSIYIAISLSPVVAGNLPLEGSFFAGIILVGFAAAVFAILQGACYLFITSQYDVCFPKLFDSLSSSIVGFLVGMLIVSFLCLALGVMSQGMPAKDNYKEHLQLGSSAYLDFWYDTIHCLIGTKANIKPENMVAELIKKTEKKKRNKRTTQTIGAVEDVEPNELEDDKVIKDELGEPPEFDFDKI